VSAQDLASPALQGCLELPVRIAGSLTECPAQLCCSCMHSRMAGVGDRPAACRQHKEVSAAAQCVLGSRQAVRRLEKAVSALLDCGLYPGRASGQTVFISQRRHIPCGHLRARAKFLVCSTGSRAAQSAWLCTPIQLGHCRCNSTTGTYAASLCDTPSWRSLTTELMLMMRPFWGWPSLSRGRNACRRAGVTCRRAGVTCRAQHRVCDSTCCFDFGRSK
jgi:hypothetical protein